MSTKTIYQLSNMPQPMRPGDMLVAHRISEGTRKFTVGDLGTSIKLFSWSASANWDDAVLYSFAANELQQGDILEVKLVGFSDTPGNGGAVLLGRDGPTNTILSLPSDGSLVYNTAIYSGLGNKFFSYSFTIDNESMADSWDLWLEMYANGGYAVHVQATGYLWRK